MPFSITETNNILEWALGKRELTKKPRVYIGLLTNDPEADNGTCNEVSGDTYSRILISQLGQTYPDVIGDASNRVIKNTKQINWTKAASDWPEVKGIGLYAAETGGTPFYYAKVPQPFVTEAGDVALFEAGNFQISILGVDVDIV